MIPYLNELYDDTYVASTAASAEAILDVVWPLVRPASVLDVGCGVGVFLRAALERGASRVCGVDGEWVDRDSLLVPAAAFVPHDLTQPFRVERRFDLTICVEVAEHLPDSAAAVLVESLTRSAPVVLFSAAIPGQGGFRHINEQWPRYWVERFRSRDFVAIDCIRRCIWEDPRVLWWYAQNVLLFVDREHLVRYPSLRHQAQRADTAPLPLVHPAALAQYVDRSGARDEDASLRSVVSHGRRWMRRACRRMWPGDVRSSAPSTEHSPVR